jgi:sugar phosphate isomerase/epimerase
LEDTALQLGLETFSYHLAFGRGLMTIFDFIHRTHAFGLNGVQINIGAGPPNWGHLGSGTPEHLQAVRSLLDELNLYIEIDTHKTDPTYLHQVLDICHVLGANVLRTYEKPTGNLNRDMTVAVQNLKQIIPICKNYGIYIAFENHEYETAQDVLTVIQQVNSEWIGALVDNGNGMMVWEDPNTTVETLAPYAFSSHFKDHVVIQEDGEHKVAGIALGQGSMDLSNHFRILSQQSPLSRINIEVCYDYRAPFRRPQEQGAGARLGEGAFTIISPPYDPSKIAPIKHRRSAQEDAQFPQWQHQAVEESVQYVKQLNAQFT